MAEGQAQEALRAGEEAQVSGARATVPVRWSKEPEKEAWMLGHAGGRPVADVCRDFEAEFGQPLRRTQVSLFRAEHGMQSRRGNRAAHDWRRVPVGAERVSKGYVMVKVRELPEAPQSKDNWERKQVLVWERTRGLRLPGGWMVLFCDHDARNFDPANLKAIPRALVGVMNSGPAWSDRASCEAAVALAWLKRGVVESVARPRRCGVCGREFTPDIGGRQGASQITCRECLDKGLRAPRGRLRAGTCPECGRAFETRSGRRVYCSKECWYEHRKREARADGGR